MLETAHTQDLYHHYQTAHCLRAEMFRAVFAWIISPFHTAKGWKAKRAARMAQPDLMPCGC